MDVRILRSFILVSALLLGACSSIVRPVNQPVDPGRLQSESTLPRTPLNKPDDYHVVLAFSGGGTRAAALSYGVLQELRETRLQDAQRHLLSEVDIITSVSGGSFTSAYYGLFGDRIFTDYEKVFLRQDVKGSLVRKLFSPGYWLKSLFSGFDRTEMAVSYYENTIFKGATFGDIQPGAPFIEINATDLASGLRFPFTPSAFDFICSDWEAFPVARAVTASSAVPVLFSPVVLKNYAGECGYEFPLLEKQARVAAESTEYGRYIIGALDKLGDSNGWPYIHLVDGGIADNLGLRSVIERVDMLGAENLAKEAELPDEIMVVLVNAETNPESGIEQSSRKPGLGKTVGAFSHTQIARYNIETKTLFEQRLAHYQQALNRYRDADKPLRITYVELNFSSIGNEQLRYFFNNLPTTFTMSDDEVDSLIAAGRLLLRSDEGYQAFIRRIGATEPEVNAETQATCRGLFGFRC
jgi:NTE family protein